MTYSPRATGTRWARDQIFAALRVHGMLTLKQLAESIGCVDKRLAAVMYPMSRAHELSRQRIGLDVVWQLGPAAPPPVNVEQFEQHPLEWHDDPGGSSTTG